MLSAKTRPEMERAHGDKMQVGLDSVEAFEEALWYKFWPKKYKNKMIEPWSADEQDADSEFDSFFKRHIYKLGANQNNAIPSELRYLSKNNANICRIPKLLRLFPNATVVVPFRRPINHVFSMFRQHENFLRIHAEDRFAKQYMRDLGHFDFGANFRPINFGNWLPQTQYKQNDPNFWLQYWCETARQLLANTHSSVCFICYDSLCESASASLAKLEVVMQLSKGVLQSQASRFHAQTEYAHKQDALDPALKYEAKQLYDQLLGRAINGKDDA